MEYNNLDELMKIQKKGEAPKAKKALYEKEMSVLLENEGLSEKAVSYLKTGFSFSGARPFATGASSGNMISLFSVNTS